MSSDSLSNDPREIRIAYLGGGSRAWARNLMQDLALSGIFSGELRLYDIDHQAAERNVEVARQIFGRPEARTKFRVRAVRRLGDCLRGADFVVLSIEPGPIEAREADLEIPEAYGILQPVGDTTGPGGIVRALRALPVYAEFAEAIMERCPEAWVINYTNPMTLCTRIMDAVAPGIRVFGCCHEVFGTQKRLAGLVEKWFEVPAVAREEIRVDVTGVNHFTWVTEARWRGENLMARLRAHVADEAVFADATAFSRSQRKAGKWFGSRGLVSLDLLRRFGALGAAGDRHLVEFVPWYVRDLRTLHRWGVICTPYSYRQARTKQKDLPPETYGTRPLTASGEEGVRQMAALVGLGDLVTNVNLPNRGQAPDLPLGAVVETNAAFGAGSISPLTANPLPPGARTLVQRVVDVQERVLEAALERDLSLAREALLCDPLVTLPTETAMEMFTAMTAHEAVAPMLAAQGYR